MNAGLGAVSPYSRYRRTVCLLPRRQHVPGTALLAIACLVFHGLVAPFLPLPPAGQVRYKGSSRVLVKRVVQGGAASSRPR